MKTESYELILNHITHGEQIFNNKNPEKYEEYKQMAFIFLNHKGKFLFEEDILNKYRDGMTLERLFDQNNDRFVQGANHKKDGKNQKTWYDLDAVEEIESENNFFDYFFACKLRHISLLQIDKFLDFHLEYSFKNERQDYFRFLNIILRQHQKKLDADILETVKEWIKLGDDGTSSKELSGTENEIKSKGKIKRERDDRVTQLNQEQTALLIYCLRRTGIILKGEYLNNKEAGLAFSILTGYSAETIRQNLNKSELARVATRKNIEIVNKALKELQKFIDNELEPEG